MGAVRGFVEIALEQSKKCGGDEDEGARLHRMVKSHNRRCEFERTLASGLAHCGPTPAVELPAGEQSAQIVVPDGKPAALSARCTRIDSGGRTVRLQASNHRLE